LQGIHLVDVSRAEMFLYFGRLFVTGFFPNPAVLKRTEDAIIH